MRKTPLLILAALTLAAGLPARAADDFKTMIRAAAPDTAYAKPAKKRKLLVFTLTRGYRHSSLPEGVEAMRVLGQKTGAWEIVVHSDAEIFRPERLKAFDAICLMSATGELFRPRHFEKLDPEAQAEALAREKPLQQSLLDYVAGGGGLVGIHAATDAFYEWPAFGRLIGGYFDGHPWTATSRVHVKVDEPGHPLTAMFEGGRLELRDEIYQFKEPYSRGRQRVLLSLDMSQPGMNRSDIKREDGDFAVSWIRREGKGRVFYCSLGHRKDVYWNPVVLRHYLAGVQFALGDLDADASPSDAPTTRPDELTHPPAEAEGFRRLFDGEVLSAWDCKEGGWVIEDGAIARRPGAGFIWSKEQFGDFVLDLEFKISEGGNSGVLIRTGSRDDWLHSGIEVQVSDSHGKATAGKHDCGAIYDCLAPSQNAAMPAGRWQRMTVRCRGPMIDVVLNGRHVIRMDLDRWTEARRNPDGTTNKFSKACKDMPRSGYIGFQDHGSAVWYRNVRIRELKAEAGQ